MRSRSLLLSAVACLLCGCTTITEEMPQPTKPDVGTPVPLPVVVVPVPIPSPVPATPAPAPTANPAQPTPAPPSGQGCGVGPGGGSGNDCPREQPSFLSEVEGAMDQLVREEPQLFNLNKTLKGCVNCYQVVNADRYVQRMAELMSQRGLCGLYDGEELAVKRTNAFNDQYDIFTADGFMRRQLGSYRSTCYPAWF
ncbi:MAG: hypothetical protein DMF81_11820 [Acidobacteria bacterium]|nr:MAG: hypothetical protein DMF81_11820 [Acidobacteriota bacterium]